MFKFASSSNLSSKSSSSSSEFSIPKPEPVQVLDNRIINLICEELQFETYMALDQQLRTSSHLAARQGLLSFGLSSKAFLEPALNVLWRILSSVDPLLSVLPETTIVEGKKMLVKQIAPKSWDRLRFYTSRVQTFDQRILSEKEESSIHTSVYARLGQIQPIFPVLAEFHPTISISVSNSLMFFLSRTINMASLPAFFPHAKSSKDVEEGIDYGPSLSILAWKSPGIQTLYLESDARYSGFSASITCFHNLKSLRIVRLSHYDSDFINGIASLQKLSYLNLTLPDNASFDVSDIKGGFPSLNTLRISGSPGEIHKILKLVSTSTLSELRLTCNLHSVWEENRTGMPDLTRCLDRFSSLAVLEVSSISEIDLNLFDAQFLWLLFSPILRSSLLRKLAYELPLFLTDQRAAEMAVAWPHIESLSLTSETWGEGIPPIESLRHFAEHCPRLESLEFPVRVNFVVDLKPPSPPPPTLFMHPLRNFRCILYDDVKSPAIVALHLYQIFPGLKWADGPGSGWSEVQSTLNAFHFLSKQDRQLLE
ncbi:hypothetical protein DFJ43DRAFT_1156202 [Lentinula guzmanii]|uniref:F-box domain-containing protein n=1 Tax=Lentinula guzmanii TaxID=2804957 RepID=A0AA38J824_9AGAR|nr:hypothetical protein DFJ43DRAFT_1156202 [Lentinula guzmanii]